jgi:hypothetical protein
VAPVDVTIRAVEPSDVVAFVLNSAATITREGTVGDLALREFYRALKQPVTL